MKLNRRQLLKALGLGTLAGARGFAQSMGSPSRIVFFVQPHAHLRTSWNLPVTSGSERALTGLSSAEFSPVLRPLQPFAKHLLAVEGLAHTSVLEDLAQVQKHGGDNNNHQIAVAGLLTGARAAQIPGARCTGGARSLDQELALRTSAPGRFASRVWGADYVPNQTVAPFSFIGSKQAAPIVADPAAALSDLLGYTQVPDAKSALRRSVLDAVKGEYAAVKQTLDEAGRAKLDQHQALVRDLELSIAASTSRCELTLNATEHKVAQFMRLTALALACDLTRVVTYVAPVPRCPEFGYPADADVHGSYAHASIDGMTSCNAVYSPVAAAAMDALSAWYGGHFARLLTELDAVKEGDGTLLDHTVVVWLTELGTPTHEHHDVFTLLAGGCNRFFSTGRYVKYARDIVNPLAGFPSLGPAQNRLFVSLLRAMGQSDDGFGMTEATSSVGQPISLKGALTELHR